MNNFINSVSKTLLVSVALLCLFTSSMSSASEDESRIMDALLRNHTEKNIHASDPETQRAMEKYALENQLNLRNKMLDELLAQANEMMNGKTDPVSLKKAQNYVIKQMKLVDAYFEKQNNSCNDQIPNNRLIPVMEFYEKEGRFAYNKDTKNMMLSVLSIEVDSDDDFTRGSAIVYKNNKGEVKITTPSHSFYGEPDDPSKNHKISAILMDDSTKEVKKRLRINVDYDDKFLNCLTKDTDNMPVSEVHRDRCTINLNKASIKKLLNFGTTKNKLKPLSLITDDEVKKLGKNPQYFMIATGIKSKLGGKKVVRTYTKCNSVELAGNLVKHDCNTQNSHSGGALVVLVGEEFRLVAMHRGASVATKFDEAQDKEVIDYDKSFNYAIRIND
ncbi:MAG: hypothetical protein HOO06_11095 [Bdellovibrionaceae bacterium]|nr:hypothetical protein [Pseudobdellovibrionaceae bacterium]